MIVVYAQAREREGIDAAIDGLAVDADDPLFTGVRQRSMRANLRGEAARAGGVVVHRDAGIVRIQIDQSTTEDQSRVIVVLASRSLRDAREGQARLITQTAEAIGRHLDPSDLDAAIAIAARVVDKAYGRKLVVASLSLGLLALGLGTAAALRRSSR